MGDIRIFIFTTHPTMVFLPTIFVLAGLALSSTPTFVPLVICLSILKTFARIIVPRPGAYLQILLLWICVSLGVAFAQLIPSLHALSTPTTSLVVLTSLSAVTSLVALLTIFLDARLCTTLRLSPWSEFTLFPLVWAIGWFLVSSVSPVGRLVTWSPVLGIESYKWLSQWAGPVAIDWVVAAWAVLGYRAIGAWFIGCESEEIPHENHHGNFEAARSRHFSSSRSFFILGAILALLAVPSVIFNDIPLPSFSPDTTPFTVGCVLPIPRLSQSQLLLDDFISETRTLNKANIVLWPEGAVVFDSDATRDAAFEKIGQALPGHHIGIGFEESVPGQDRKRTGLALIHRSGTKNSTVVINLMYYKRHLVPIAESFSFSPSQDPPSIFTLDLTHPSGIPKTEWGSPPNYTRPIAVTASICLDFSHPSAFLQLPSRPTLILAPARTWHTTIGVAMWEQAKARAEELGSMVLWCDGGKGGVSGIAGRGISGVTQVGPGSWTRTIGVQWPFEETRTVYARRGDLATLLLFTLLTTGNLIVCGILFLYPANWLGIRWVGHPIQRINNAINEWKERRQPNREEAERGDTQPLLVDL